MDPVSSPAMSSARELRRTLGPNGCARRAMRNAPRLMVFSNLFNQRKTPAVTSDQDWDPPPSGRPVVSNPAEEDFLQRAKQLQRRIAKLRQLQEKLAQLKEEGDFATSVSDPDSSTKLRSGDDSLNATSSTLASLPGAASGGASTGPIPNISGTTTPGVPTVRLRPPGPNPTSEELRQWVAAIIAQSAARSGTRTTPVSSSSSSKPSVSSSGTPLPDGNLNLSSGPPGSSGEEGRESGASSSTGPSPPTQASPGRLTPTTMVPTASRAPVPATAAPRAAPSSGSERHSGSSHRSHGGGASSKAAQPLRGASPSAGDPAVRRYTVRYASDKPVFVPLVAPGAPSKFASAAGGTGPVDVIPTVPTPAAAAAAASISTVAAAAATAGASPTQLGQSTSTSAPSSREPPSPVTAPSMSPVGSNGMAASRSSTTASWRSADPSAAPNAGAALTSSQLQPKLQLQPGATQPPPPQQQQKKKNRVALSDAAALPGASKVTPLLGAPDEPTPTADPAPTPPRDPNAELRATIFPESLTSTNPYTLYDMPLPPLPLRDSWRTAAERKADEATTAATAVAVAAVSSAAPPLGGGAAAAGHGRTERPRDLVFVTAEAAPWSKTGGLGDVMGALPRALAARGHRVMVLSPRYLSPSTEDRYKGLTDTGVRARLDLGPSHAGGGGVHEVGYFHTHKDGVDWVFVDHMSYHREGTPYGNDHGTYGDNLFRFSLLCLAACEAPLLLHIGGYRGGTPPGLPYGQDVTFIANDWHAGLVPVYVAAKYRKHGVFKKARCVLALHNLAHQGAHPPHCFSSLGLPGEWYGALEWVQTPGAGGTAPTSHPRVPTINILKAALVTSDRLVTVSPAYAWEIAGGPNMPGGTGNTEGRHADGERRQHFAGGSTGGCAGGGGGRSSVREDHGVGLGSLLRQRAADLGGIVNGIDTLEWDPRTDPYLPRNYHAGSLGGKGLCKAALQGAMRLPVDPAAPLLGFIGRLDYQKGPDLVLQALPQLVAAGCQVVLLGSGAPDYEEAFRAAEAAFPANVRAHVGFSVPLSHRILAAADILLMPSRFEPCGLNQLYAMRYGTVPVAHGTGGLRDTIDDVKPFLGERPRDKVEDLDELFSTGLAWGRRTASRSADDPSANNAEYYQPFQDYFGSSGRYGPVDEDNDEYGSDEYDDDGNAEDSNLPSWRRGLKGLRRSRDPGTGWTFAPASCEAMLDAVTAALVVYEHHPDKWRRIQLAGMRRDFSWGRAARQWEAVLDGVHAGAAYCK